MGSKDILVCLRPQAKAESCVALAARIAARTDSKVVGVCLPLEPAAQPADCWAIGRAAVADVVEHRKAQLASMVAPDRAAFAAAMSRAHVRASFSVAPVGECPEECALRAEGKSLVVLNAPDDLDPEQRRLVEILAVRGGAPCLIAPAGDAPPRPFSRVMIAWDGSEQAGLAVQAGLRLFEPGAQVEVLTVGQPAQEIHPATSALIDQLSRFGFEASHRRIQAGHPSIGYALLRRCDVFGADLLVMGAFVHPRCVEALLGGVTRTVISRAQIPVLLAH